jgi:hypothetical protein
MASTLDAVIARAPAERRLYTWAAVVALLVVFAGFAPTYYLKGVIGEPGDLGTMRHVHGLVMTGWFALFLVQARLVAAGRTDIHRRLGAAGIVVAALVIGVGMATAIGAVRAGSTPNGIPPLVFLVLPTGEMVAFAALFAAAIALRKRAAWHKRLMLLASLSMLAPAMARMPLDFVRAGGPPAFFAMVDLVLIACIAVDTLRNRRIHPAFVAGLAFIVLVQVGRLAISGTAAWTSFAQWMVG